MWVNEVKLTDRALNILLAKRESASLRGLSILKEKRIKVANDIKAITQNQITLLPHDPTVMKLIASLLYWGEGEKSSSCVSFTNSDPSMIGLFIYLLRNYFGAVEHKFRVNMQLHDYHDEVEMKKYWREVTGIEEKLFAKTYIKPHTGKIRRKDYHGSIRIKYYDFKIVAELKYLYNALVGKVLGA